MPRVVLPKRARSEARKIAELLVEDPAQLLPPTNPELDSPQINEIETSEKDDPKSVQKPPAPHQTAHRRNQGRKKPPQNLQRETLGNDGLEGHGPLTCVGVTAGGEPVGEHEVPGLGHDGLGVELDALEGQGAVAHAHDDAGLGGRGNLELLGHGRGGRS